MDLDLSQCTVDILAYPCVLWEYSQYQNCGINLGISRLQVYSEFYSATRKKMDGLQANHDKYCRFPNFLQKKLDFKEIYET